MKNKLLVGIVCLLLISVSFASQYQTSIHSPSISSAPQLDSPGSFETDLFPGSATYAYDIFIPPARSISPSVSLYYNSHMTKSTPTEVESAWSLSHNYIERDTKGTNKDELTLVFMGQSHKLVEVDVFTYKTKFDSFLQIKTGFDDKFTVKTPDGSHHTFDKIIPGPYGGSLGTKYYLTKSTDTFGNTVEYFYGSFSQSTNVYYLDYIVYDDVKYINFSYEAKPNSYPTYKDGLKSEYSHRLKQITSTFDGEEVSKYILYYTTVGEYKQFLHKIKRVADEEQIVTFTYNEPQIGWVQDSRFTLPSSATFGTDIDKGARFMDLNGDGIIDFYKIYGTSTTSWQISKLQGTPTGWKSSDWDFVDQDTQITYQGLDWGYRFADINGDMFVDVLQLQCNDIDDEEHVYINTGREWIEDTNYRFSFLPCIIDFTNVENEGVQVIDVNADGYADILESKSSDNDVHINLGDGKGWDTNAWDVPTTFYTSGGNDNGVRLADVNGDGLPDIIENKGSDKKLWLNTGFGWTISTHWPILDEFEFIEINSGPDDDKGVRLADINGDGLVDILRADDDANIKSVWINTGNGWTQKSITIPTYFVDNRNDNLGVRIVDFNGDTYPDIILANDNDQNAWRHTGNANFYLNEITYENIVQPTTTISYVPSTIYEHTLGGVSTLGFPMYVVDTIIQTNDRTDIFDLTTQVKQNYSGGVYDTEQRQFTGFRQVVSEDFDTISTSNFHQDFQRRGHIKSSTIEDKQGNIIQESLYTWSFTKNNDVFTTQLDRVQLIEYGESSPRSSSTEYTYDQYNNVLIEKQNGEDYSIGDEKYINTNYTINTNKWILHNPATIEKRDSENSLLSKVTFAYDNQEVGTAPTKGALTKESVWNDDSYLTSSYTYNNYGNVLSETDPKGQVTTYSYGTMDTSNTFPDSITNPLGFTTSYTYDKFGNIVSEIDTNGRETFYYFDEIGRPTAITMYGETKNRTSIDYTYGIDTYKVTETQLSGINGEFEDVLITYMDAFGNTINTKQYRNGESNYIGKYSLFNPDMTIKKSSVGFYSLTSNLEPSESAQTFEYEYDILDRVIRVVNPDSTSKNTLFTGWQKTSYDEENHSQTFYYDAYKRVKAIQENNGNEQYMTFYEYDGNDNIITITQSDGSQILFTYDTLGRVLTETDGDFTKKYTYDKVGNIIAVEYPTRKESFKYDEINRITEKRSNNEIFDFYYDEYLDGTLSRVVGENYVKSLSYDDLYRVSQKDLTIMDDTFTVIYDYGYNDELLEEKYVEETITFEYDFQGKITQLDTVATFIYTALGIIDEIELSNSRVSDYTYDPVSLRLSNITYDEDYKTEYSYTDSGLISSMSGVENKQLFYDDLLRLEKEISGSTQTTFTIDSIGRIIKKETNTQAELFTYDNFNAPVIISSITPEFISECQDGIDNDGDGNIDLADEDCDNEFDNNENSNDLFLAEITSPGYFDQTYFGSRTHIIKIPKNATVKDAYVIIRGTIDER